MGKVTMGLTKCLFGAILLALCINESFTQSIASYARTCSDCNSTNALCTPKTNYVQCACKAGFVGNGLNCTRIVLCDTYPCCPQGYSWDSAAKQCVDIDECQKESTYACISKSYCNNKNGIYTCSDPQNPACPTNPCPADQFCVKTVSSSGLASLSCIDPCEKHEVIDGSNRLYTLSSPGRFSTDRYLFGWYRYSNNLKMKEGCVGAFKCGSLEPYTLSSHPTLNEGVKSVNLIINGQTACSTGSSIYVKACPGGFYVYRFYGLMKFEVYCTEPIPPTTTTMTTTSTTTTTPTTTTSSATSTTDTTTTTTTTTTTSTTATTPTSTFTTTPTSTSTTTPTTTSTTVTTPTSTITTTPTLTSTTTPTSTSTTTPTSASTTTPTSTSTTTPTSTSTAATTTTHITSATTTPTTTSTGSTITTPSTTSTNDNTITTTKITSTTNDTSSLLTSSSTPTNRTPTTAGGPNSLPPSVMSSTHSYTEKNITVTVVKSKSILSVTTSSQVINNAAVRSLEINETTTVNVEIRTINPSTIHIKHKNSTSLTSMIILVGGLEPEALRNLSDTFMTSSENTVPNLDIFSSDSYCSQPAKANTVTETFAVAGNTCSKVTSAATTITTTTTEEVIVLGPDGFSKTCSYF